MIMILHATPANCLDTNKTYTISEVALIIHVSPHVLRRWESEGYVIPSIRTEFGHRRYTEEDIQKLIKHKEVVNNIEYVSNRELETKGPLLIATETAKIRKLNTKFALGTLGLVFFLIASFFTIKIRSGIQSIYKGLTVGNLTSHPAVASNVLAAGASIADYIFTVNSSTIFARDVKVNDKVTITGQATLSGGITTNNANIDIGTGTIRASNLTLSGLGDVSGILSVDAISKKTLEKTLDIGGDVNGTGLNNVKLKKNFIDENYLASSIDYDGDLTLSGTLDITGTYAIGGTTVTVTAEELNSLGGLTGDISDLNMLDGTTAATGGVMFGNGTIITQDSGNLSWDDTNNRLGVGTSNPTTTLDVAGSVKLGSAVSDVVTIAGSLATGSSITPATDLGSDLGSNNKRFNNLWVANINSNESTNLGGQTILTYAPTDTTYTQSSLMLNPTAPAANGYLTGWGVAGYQRAGMDAEGDIRVGYTGDISIPASDNPFEIYGHNTTKVMTVDTGGNTALSGNLAIDTSTLFVDAGNNRIGYFDATPLSMIDYNLNFNLDNRGNNTLTYGGTVYNTDIYRKNISLTATTNINSSWSYDMLDLFNIEIPASTTADLSRGFIQGRTLLFNNNTGGKSPLIIGDSVTVANRPTGSAANSVYGQSVNISNYANPSISQFFGRTGSAYQYGPGTVSELYGISNYTAPTTASVSNNAAASTVYGIYNAAFTEGITSGYTASATNLYADRNLAYASARNGGTSTIGTGAYGGRFLVFANGDASSIASINNGYGVYASVGAYGHATNSIMTNAYGVYVSNGINASPRGAITNNYALYIEDQTQGLAQNFSIYSAGGKNYFGGNVGIGTTNPSAKLQITQTTISNPSIRLLFNEDVYGSDNVFEVKTNTNAIKVAVTEAGSLISNSIGSSYTTTVGGLAGTFSSGNNITALGYRAAYAASSKNYITAVGVDTGYYNRGNYFTGYGYNAGAAAGSYTSTGDYVTSIGAFAGAQSRVDNVTALGYSSGYQNSGAGGVFLGVNQGYQNTIANRLMIGNNSTTSLIDGIMTNDTSTSRLTINGLVGIGTTAPSARLHVVGSSDTQQLIVKGNATQTANLTEWQNSSGTVLGSVTSAGGAYFAGNVGIGTTAPASKLEVSGGDIRVTGGSFIDDGANLDVPDYVFDSEYNLLPLNELANYVNTNKHMPNIPDMTDKSGWALLSLQDRDMRLLEKIEENTLYILDLQKQIQSSQSTESAPATTSGLLAEIQKVYDNFTSFVQTLGITNENGTLLIQSDLSVSGSTTLSELTVTGSISAGLLTINPLESSIDILGASCYKETENTLDTDKCDNQTLYLQKNLAGNVSVFDGKIILRPDGTIEVNKLKVNEIEISDAETLGSATIRAGESSVTVDTSKIKNNSSVFITPTTETGKQALIVSDKSEGSNFTVSVESSHDKDIKFDWWIVNASN